MDNQTYKVLAGIALCLAAGVYWFKISRGTGPLDTARAEWLLNSKLSGQVNSIEVIAPDGELAHARPPVLEDSRAIGCPKLESHLGSLPGRYGSRGRTYGGASFQCLFAGKGAHGATLYFSSHVHRTSDPEIVYRTGGETLSFQRGDATRALMETFDRKTGQLSGQAQLDLWAELAADDVYVPADKRQKSPTQKGMETFLKRIRSE